MENSKIRKRIEKFLIACNGELLKREFNEGWLNEIIPGLNILKDCSQGTILHLEGDVAVHTGLVFDNLGIVTNNRLNRNPDFIEYLAVVLHDCRKPQTRTPQSDGGVGFPGHEELAAKEIPRISKLLDLSIEESDKLYFLVARHGDAHHWQTLNVNQQEQLTKSPWIKCLAVLQEADAISCLLHGGGHIPVFWDQIIK